ncbi:hypothetical protein [Brevirhabdus sp.]|uniref:hypothetical protein n=1 Tax=Brevirhabdus sp. TaxID=2004514 RepID=UPI004058F215
MTPTRFDRTTLRHKNSEVGSGGERKGSEMNFRRSAAFTVLLATTTLGTANPAMAWPSFFEKISDALDVAVTGVKSAVNDAVDVISEVAKGAPGVDGKDAGGLYRTVTGKTDTIVYRSKGGDAKDAKRGAFRDNVGGKGGDGGQITANFTSSVVVGGVEPLESGITVKSIGGRGSVGKAARGGAGGKADTVLVTDNSTRIAAAQKGLVVASEGGTGAPTDVFLTITRGRGGDGGAADSVTVTTGSKIRGGSSDLTPVDDTGVEVKSVGGQTGGGGSGGKGGSVKLTTLQSSDVFSKMRGVLAASIGGDSPQYSTGPNDGGNGGAASSVTVDAYGRVERSGVAVEGGSQQVFGVGATSQGGRGGDAAVSVAVGDDGGKGGRGGTATATLGSTGYVKDFDIGVRVESHGGNGGDGGIVVAGVSGSGGDGGDASAAEATVNGEIVNGVVGVEALSIGGSAGLGADILAGGVAGEGGKGGDGKNVTVTVNEGARITGADISVLARSNGGRGSGGGSSGVAGAAGDAGRGGKSGNVTVTNEGTLASFSDYGVRAMSVSGEGGEGGRAFIGSNTPGALGTKAGPVTITNSGKLEDGAGIGLSALSVGGGGGRGGERIAILVGGGAKGGLGGDGGKVIVDQTGSIDTDGELAAGIVAQSIGGGGGIGGGAAVVGIGFAASVGGSGGGGGNSDTVTVTNSGTIKAKGPVAVGIKAQSIGGGGGTGGFALSAAIGPAVSYAVAVGGSGEKGGTGAPVKVTTSASSEIEITGTIPKPAADKTLPEGGMNNYGILAQSIGGGGGNGGLAIAFSGAVNPEGPSIAVSTAIGGKGKGGGGGSTVFVDNAGTIKTNTDRSDAILAQSIGGGGGNGGGAVSISAAVGQGPAVAVGFAVGGAGAKGGNGAQATAISSGDLTTSGASSRGLVAQSLGGGGGNGGFAATGALSFGATAASLAGALGGDGGKGGTGGFAKATLEHGATIETTGDNANGILAQSVGGGGGTGGSTLVGTLAAAEGAAVSLSFGGKGGEGNLGGLAEVTQGGRVITKGNHADGVLVQSVGGGGGTGGHAASLSGSVEISPAISLSMGGNGGKGSKGKNVGYTATNAFVRTFGDGARGVVAQSLGGGGGAGGHSVSFASNVAPVALAAGVAVGGKGGDGNAAGDASFTASQSSMNTAGKLAHTVVVQSVGGGGGLGGSATTGALAIGLPADAQGDSVGASISFGVGGSGGTGADAGKATTTITDFQVSKTRPVGSYVTRGDGANVIVTQSIGGGGGAGGNAYSFSGAVGRGAATIGTSIGGSGSGGGKGSEARTTIGSDYLIISEGAASMGVVTQSVGGGGGIGGNALSGTLSVGFPAANAGGVALSAATSVGGKGGRGGSGGLAYTKINTKVQTKGAGSHSVVVQSLGGGGGAGGNANSYAVSLGIGAAKGAASGVTSDGLAFSSSVAVGGNGGVGAKGGRAEFIGDRLAYITTEGDAAHALTVQSVGGGGAGGNATSFTFSGTLTKPGGKDAPSAPPATGAAPGKDTGADKDTKDNSFVEKPRIPCTKEDEGKTKPTSCSLSVSVGGTGGSGNTGGLATVQTNGLTKTEGDQSHAILVQSIGGGGGAGGEASSKTLNGPNADGMAIAIGGRGGSGDLSSGSARLNKDNVGGEVTVTLERSASSLTQGAGSHAILAQSIGGGGGVGGAAGAVSNADIVDLDNDDVENPAIPEAGAGAGLTVGGFGGRANKGGKVTVRLNSDRKLDLGQMRGSVAAYGNGSYAVLAQSIGGGGGAGGVSEADADMSFSLGGFGGAGGDGGEVTVDSTFQVISGAKFLPVYDSATKSTVFRLGVSEPTAAHGIVAQSIGGGGGAGGNTSEDKPQIAEISEEGKIDFKPKLHIGGWGGAAGDGGKVEVKANYVLTRGDISVGILAQSIGGGGGLMGTGNLTGLLVGEKQSKIRSFLDIDLTAGSGDGGAVTVTTTNVSKDTGIITRGRGSHGIVAQSIGGGGGAVTINNIDNSRIITGRTLRDATVVDGQQLDRKNGGGDVIVNVQGSPIQTMGDNSVGVLAQSLTNALLQITPDGAKTVYNQGRALAKSGNVDVNVESTVKTSGKGSHGILVNADTAAFDADGKPVRARVDIKRGGKVINEGADSYAVVLEDGVTQGGAVNQDNPLKHGKASVIVASGASILSSGGQGSAVRIATNATSLGPFRGTRAPSFGVYGTVDAGANRALDASGVVDMQVIGGEVTGDLKFDTVGNSRLINEGKITGGVSGQVDYEVNGDHLLRIDPNTGKGDRIAAASVDIRQNGRLEPSLTALPRGTVANVDLVSGLTASSVEAARKALSFGSIASSYTYGARKDANALTYSVTLASASVDFGKAGLSGDNGKIAAFMNKQMNAAAAPTGALNDTLVSAANSRTREELVARTSVIDITKDYSTAAFAASNSSKQLKTLHSCGVLAVEAKSYTQQECDWQRVLVDRTAFSGGLTYKRFGGAAGFQRNVGEDLYFGMSGQISRVTFSGAGKGEGYEFGLGAIGKYDAGPWFGSLGGTLSYGMMDAERPVGGLVAKSDQRYGAAVLQGKLGYGFDLGPVEISAASTLGIGLVHRSGYTESGAGTLNLTVDDQTDFLAYLEPSLGVSHNKTFGDTRVRLFAETGLYVPLTDRRTTVSLGKGPNPSAKLTLKENNNDPYGTVSIGALVSHSETVNIKFGYDGEFGNGRNSHGGSVKVMIRF